MDSKELLCLRHKKDGRLLNVAFSIDGLKFTTNKIGKNLFYNTDTYVCKYQKKDFLGEKNPRLRKSLLQSESFFKTKAHSLLKLNTNERYKRRR